MHVPLMFLSEWREFPWKPCLPEKKNNLVTARVPMLLKSRASRDMLPFCLCNKKRLAIRHMNRLLFPTTLSISSYDIGKYFGLRTYQHSLVELLIPVCKVNSGELIVSCLVKKMHFFGELVISKQETPIIYHIHWSVTYPLLIFLTRI